MEWVKDIQCGTITIDIFIFFLVARYCSELADLLGVVEIHFSFSGGLVGRSTCRFLPFLCFTFLFLFLWLCTVVSTCSPSLGSSLYLIQWQLQDPI
jgi:hypothetical protein